MKAVSRPRAKPAATKRRNGVPSWMDTYRQEWSWDDVRWGTHCVDCYPGNCPMHVFVRDGKVLREEQASVRPGQVICYNGWDPYQFRGWRGPMDLEPGMVKWLHFAGGYWPIQWQPTPVDRAVRVEVEKVPASVPTRAAARSGRRT